MFHFILAFLVVWLVTGIASAILISYVSAESVAEEEGMLAFTVITGPIMPLIGGVLSLCDRAAKAGERRKRRHTSYS